MDNQSNILGVNVYGYLNGFDGLSKSARSNVRALINQGIAVRIIDYSYSNKFQKSLLEDTEKTNFSVNLVHVNVHSIKKFIERVGVDFLRGKYNIAYWVWEHEEPPIEVKDFSCLFEEIWTPSQFCVDSFWKMTHLPIIKIPHPIPPPNTRVIEKNHYFPNENPEFVFLTMFDSSSFFERKNPFAVVKAFLLSFKNNDKIHLIIKTKKLKKMVKKLDDSNIWFKKMFVENKNIHLIDKTLATEEIYDLYNVCDAYVSLHRCEGFGLTMAEAMSYNKPVIATGYSGNMEFMNSKNSFIVPYTLTQTAKAFHLAKKGYTFADPDIKVAAKLMKFVTEEKDNAKQIAEEGYKSISNHFSFESIGKLMNERLHWIYACGFENIDEDNYLKKREKVKSLYDKSEVSFFLSRKLFWIKRQLKLILKGLLEVFE